MAKANTPLNGITVIDLTRVLAGPFATMILADLGADVIKIERPGQGDEARNFPPFRDGVSGYFASVNRGKRSVTLDLKHPKGRELFLALIEKADVVVENFRPGVMARLGFAYEQLREKNPKLIYAAMSGFGQTGPDASLPAYDMIIQAASGIMSITGHPGAGPVRVGTSVADLGAGLFTVVGVLAALRVRERTGVGQFIDMAMLDSLVALLENAIVRYSFTGEVPGPLGSRHPAITPFQSFRSRDGHLVIAISNDKQWGLFKQIVQCAELDDPRFHDNASRTQHYSVLEPILSGLFLRHTTEEWIDKLKAAGIPCGPINSIADLFTMPQLSARQSLVTIVDPKIGEYVMAGSPLKFSDTSVAAPERAPTLGEHTAEVLGTLLGLTTAQVDGLRSEGVA